MLSGQAYTKQQIALQTGLSVASCNTYLNEMELRGEVIGQKQKVHDVGRNAVVYSLNEEFESTLCVFFQWIQGVKSITTAVLSPTGNIRYEAKSFSCWTLGLSGRGTAAVLEQFANVSPEFVVGTPSIAEKGVIRHSDLPELENVPLKPLLEERFQRPVILANDMHYKVYGYCRQEQLSHQVVTLVNYPSGVLPGTATVHEGVLLTGRNLFAGMVGFLDYGMSLEPGAETGKAAPFATAEPLIVQATIALISILNPHRLVFTGDLLEEGAPGEIRRACQKCIPEEYLPEFVFLPDTRDYYLMGMYWMAMDRKENRK